MPGAGVAQATDLFLRRFGREAFLHRLKICRAVWVNLDRKWCLIGTIQGFSVAMIRGHDTCALVSEDGAFAGDRLSVRCGCLLLLLLFKH